MYTQEYGVHTLSVIRALSREIDRRAILLADNKLSSICYWGGDRCELLAKCVGTRIRYTQSW